MKEMEGYTFNLQSVMLCLLMSAYNNFRIKYKEIMNFELNFHYIMIEACRVQLFVTGGLYTCTKSQAHISPDCLIEQLIPLKRTHQFNADNVQGG